MQNIVGLGFEKKICTYIKVQGGKMEYKQWNNILAHKELIKGKECKQYLKEHLYNTAVYAQNLGEPVGLGSTCKLIGLIHDIGKASDRWQCYINKTVASAGDHSSVGGYFIRFFLYAEIKNRISVKDVKKYNLYNEFLIYPILAHHGLYDIIKTENELPEYWTKARIEKIKKDILQQPELKEFFEALNEWSNEWFQEDLFAIYQAGFHEFFAWIPKIEKLAMQSAINDKLSAYDFYCGMLVRLLLSILKEADVYDSTNWYLSVKQHLYKQVENVDIWQNMDLKIEEKYTQWHKKKDASKLDTVRTVLADELYKAAEHTGTGCYTLPLPVGAGKTMAALRYALRHSMLFKNSRIFYITAFLSVLEQNAKEIRHIIGEEYVLEHHSNIIEDKQYTEDNENEYDKRNYVKENWEAPFVITTLVQFSNTLFKGQSSCLRRFSKLINAVIIIDEIQSLPVNAIYLYNLTMNFLTHFMKVTIVHCTATLPALDNNTALTFPCLYSSEKEYVRGQLVATSVTQNTVFSRVNFYSLMGRKFEDVISTKELLNHIDEQLQNEKSILIIVNTRTAVKTIYDALVTYLQDNYPQGECYYLTTNLCAAHRLERINKIKSALDKIRTGKQKSPLICVSTRLIEAGVNVDFDVVYRSLTSIDSVLQAAGRCNREGLRKQRGKVFIFLYQGEKIDRIFTFRLEREAAKEALRSRYADTVKSGDKIDIQNCLPEYYARLYSKNKEELFYPLKKYNTNIVNLLASNKLIVHQYNNYRNMGNSSGNKNDSDKTSFRLRQSFKKAALSFELINNKETTAIVQYKNEELIDELLTYIENDDLQKIKIVLRKLQRYTVGIYNIKEYENYLQPITNDWGIYLLDKEAYDAQIGLIKGEMNDLIF